MKFLYMSTVRCVDFRFYSINKSRLMIIAQDISKSIASGVFSDDIVFREKIREYGAVLKLSGRPGSYF